MYCTNCGKEMKEDALFCTGCGIKKGESGYLIKVTRPKKIFGVAISFKIYVDDVELGKLSNGVSLEKRVPAGSHKVSIDALEKTIDQEVILDDEHKEVEIFVSVGFGVIAGRPKIDSIQYR